MPAEQLCPWPVRPRDQRFWFLLSMIHCSHWSLPYSRPTGTSPVWSYPWMTADHPFTIPLTDRPRTCPCHDSRPTDQPFPALLHQQTDHMHVWSYHSLLHSCQDWFLSPHSNTASQYMKANKCGIIHDIQACCKILTYLWIFPIGYLSCVHHHSNMFIDKLFYLQC